MLRKSGNSLLTALEPGKVSSELRILYVGLCEAEYFQIPALQNL